MEHSTKGTQYKWNTVQMEPVQMEHSTNGTQYKWNLYKWNTVQMEPVQIVHSTDYALRVLYRMHSMNQVQWDTTYCTDCTQYRLYSENVALVGLTASSIVRMLWHKLYGVD